MTYLYRLRSPKIGPNDAAKVRRIRQRLSVSNNPAELDEFEEDLEPVEGLGERSICSAEPPGFEVSGMPMSRAEDRPGWYAAWIGDADEWLPVLVRDNLCFEDAYVYEIDFDAARSDGFEFYWMPWDPDPYVWNKGETPDSIMVLSRTSHIPAKYVRLVRKVPFDQIEAAEDPYGQAGYGFEEDEAQEDYDDNPVKAQYTGDRCDGGLNVYLNGYLLDRAKEVSYRTFAKHVDVRSFELGRLGSCDHCTFLRSTFPSGKPAWVLQWSGFEHLAATPDVEVSEETEAAVRYELSPKGMPVVWWDDERAVRALGGYQAMNDRYEATLSMHARYDREANRWITQTIAWLVPSADLAGIDPKQRDAWDVQSITHSNLAKARYDEPERGIFVHRDNPTNLFLSPADYWLIGDEAFEVSTHEATAFDILVGDEAFVRAVRSDPEGRKVYESLQRKWGDAPSPLELLDDGDLPPHIGIAAVGGDEALWYAISSDPASALMQYRGAVRISADDNVEVWKLTRKVLDRIRAFLSEHVGNAAIREAETRGSLFCIDELSTSRSRCVSIADFLAIDKPEQFWRIPEAVPGMKPNPVADEDDVRDKLRRYGEFVEWFAQVRDKKTRDGEVDRYAIAATLKIAPDRLRFLYKASDVFRDLLVGYQMTPKQRKILERAARDANRRSIRFKMSDLGRAYKKNLDAYVEYAKVAAEVFVGGKQVTRSACPTAGGFHIINAGGFNDKVMGTVSEVICEASNRLTKAGLESIIYGDVNIVGSITGSARLLAQYQIGTDEIFVRANLRGRTGPAVRTILHELAHRLEFKFFTDQLMRQGRRLTHRSIQRLYDRLAERYDEKLREAMTDPANWPKQGDVLNKQWVVTGVSGGGTRYGKVHLHHIDEPKALARTSLEGYVRNRYPATNVFVTLYAATDPSENFAEMVAELCLGNLNSEQEKMLMDTINEGLGL